MGFEPGSHVRRMRGIPRPVPWWQLMANVILEPKKNKFGPLRVLLRTDGIYVVYDARLPLANRTIFLTDSFASACEHAMAISGVTEGVDSTKDDE